MVVQGKQQNMEPVTDVPEVSAWVAATMAIIERAAQLPAGQVKGLRMYAQASHAKASWNGWALGLVGLEVPDAGAGGPIWTAIQEADDGTRSPYLLQVWGLRTGPPGSRVQVDLGWRPGMGQPELALIGWGVADAPAAQRVLSGAVALLAHVERRGRKALEDDPTSPYRSTIDLYLPMKQKNPKWTRAICAYHLGTTEAALKKYLDRWRKEQRRLRNNVHFP